MTRSDPTEAAAAEDLQAQLNYHFGDQALFHQALTHASATDRSSVPSSNERLEFLGDRVLGLAVAAMLHETFPHADEGELARRFNQLVRRETCAEVALGLGVDRALHLSLQEASAGGRRKAAILADACEALLAAVFIDGGFAAADAIVQRVWGPLMRKSGMPVRDAKTTLQEWLQAAGHPPPLYVMVARDGPDHAPSFTVRVEGAGCAAATGVGRSKRDAEQAAAQAVLQREGLWGGAGRNDG